MWTALGVTLLIIGISFVIWEREEPDSTVVEIIQDGMVLHHVDISNVNDRVFVVEYKQRKNVIQVRNGTICMLFAECPDQACVHMGALKPNGLPIVCLPNHLVIRFVSVNEKLDAMAN